MVPLRGPHDRRRLPGPPADEPIMVDGNRDEPLPWPVETSRFAYLTPFGGHAVDVDPGTVGIHKQALLENTELAAGDTVTITVYGGPGQVPFMFRHAYEVVALDFTRPEAFLRGIDGEAVLAADEPESARHRIGQIREGVRLVLNGVLGRHRGSSA